MKIINYIILGFSESTGGEPPIREMLRERGLLDHVKLQINHAESFGTIFIDCEESIGKKVLDLLQAVHIKSMIRRDAVYTRSELDSAELLGLTLDLHPAAEYAVAPEYDTTVPGACPACLSGTRIVGDVAMVLDRRALKNSINQMYCGPLIVDRHVRDALIQAGAKSEEFVRARCTLGGKSVEDRYQVQPLCVLPRLHPDTKGMIRSDHRRETPCPKCGRDGFFSTAAEPLMPVLERSKVEPLLRNARDLALLASTWEHFRAGPHPDRPETVLPGDPMIVLNQAARRALMAVCKAKFVWWPIKLI